MLNSVKLCTAIRWDYQFGLCSALFHFQHSSQVKDGGKKSLTEMSVCNKAIKYKSTKIKEKIRGVFWDVIDQGWCQGKTVGGGLTAWVISQTVPPPRPIVSLHSWWWSMEGCSLLGQNPKTTFWFYTFTCMEYSDIHGSMLTKIEFGLICLFPLIFTN